MSVDPEGTRPPRGGGVFGKALLLLSGNAAASLLSLLRNLLIARLIPVEDYGIAATFAAVMSFVEMLSAFGLQQQVIQSKQDDRKWLAALQGFQFARAVLSALVLFFSAGLIAEFLGVPDVAWAYQVLALAPLLNGLVHLDIYRMTRSLRYGPMILTLTVPVLVSLIAVWPLYLAFGDYRVMLYAVLLQAGLMMVISILTAERRLRLSLERAAVGKVLRFGWPLLINNILLFAVLNGEKIVVGRELGMAMLGVFALGFTLTLTPTMVLAKSVQSFFLPQLSAVQDDDARFQPLARATIEANLFNGAFLVVAIVLVGEPFVRLVMGEKYAALVPLMVWLAILQAMRVFKAGGAVVSLARAKTENAMIANSFRVLSLPLSWWAAVETGDLLLVIWIATGGEVLGVIASLVQTRWRAGVRLARLWPVVGSVVALLAAAALFAGHGDIAALAPVPRWTLAALCVALLTLCGWTMRDTQAYLRARKMENRAG
jgi:O-antigen/teichoic acid export membrane protein